LWKGGVDTVSIWCFSTENWQRDFAEVFDVMQVIVEGINQALLPLCLRMEAQILHLGRRDRLPSYVLQALDAAIEKTKAFSKHAVNLCIDYGGQDEICRMLEKLQTRNMLGTPVATEHCAQFLDTAGQRHPNPDLIVRTSGERRLSGFFLWQSAYSEFSFFNKLFPDLTPTDMQKALDDYASRQRRYGK
jgi:undecaprenyl diphosphate synthase